MCERKAEGKERKETVHMNTAYKTVLKAISY